MGMPISLIIWNSAPPDLEDLKDTLDRASSLRRSAWKYLGDQTVKDRDTDPKISEVREEIFSYLFSQKEEIKEISNEVGILNNELEKWIQNYKNVSFCGKTIDRECFLSVASMVDKLVIGVLSSFSIGAISSAITNYLGGGFAYSVFTGGGIAGILEVPSSYLKAIPKNRISKYESESKGMLQTLKLLKVRAEAERSNYTTLNGYLQHAYSSKKDAFSAMFKMTHSSRKITDSFLSPQKEGVRRRTISNFETGV